MSMNEHATLERPSSATDGDDRDAPPAQKLWYDGALVDPRQFQATLSTHAMHYGSGVFEGIRAYATKQGTAIFRLREHMERMRRGAEAIGMAFDVDDAIAATVEVMAHNRLGDAYIRPLAWYGDGNFGLDVEGRHHHLMVATSATNVHLGGSRTRVAVSRWRRNPADSLPPLKLCGAYVNSILAKRDAKSRGFEEAMFVDAEGFVVECSGANLFMVRDGTITAVSHRDALPGITRDTLLQLTGAHERPVTLDELLDADEVFACGTAAEVAPIGAIGRADARDGAADRVFGGPSGTSPVSRELADLYARTVRGEAVHAADWLTRV